MSKNYQLKIYSKSRVLYNLIDYLLVILHCLQLQWNLYIWYTPFKAESPYGTPHLLQKLHINPHFLIKYESIVVCLLFALIRFSILPYGTLILYHVD